jgi:hypothetical protein
MSYRNTNKPNGRPPNTERNNAIIAAFNDGVPADEIAKTHNLEKQYVQKIFSVHKQKLKEQEIADEGYGSVRLYAERDAQMRDFFNSLNTKGALSKLHMQDMGRVNAGYTPRKTT